MRDYQRKKTKYILPKTVYNKTLWTIRDYHRCKEEVETMISVGSGNSDGTSSGAPGDPTYRLAVKYADFLDIVNAIDMAKDKIPKEYREGIWNNILYDVRYPRNAERATYGHIKSKFIYDVAINLHFV